MTRMDFGSELDQNQDAALSRLMDYLPAVYHGLDDTDLAPSAEESSGQLPFLNFFLLAFEKVLLGRDDGIVPGVSEEGSFDGKGAPEILEEPEAPDRESQDRIGGQRTAEPRAGGKKKTRAESREGHVSDRKGGDVAGRTPEPRSSAEESEKFRSIEEEVNDLHRIFEPEHTPPRFLAWLAGWAALSLEASLSEEKKRKLIARIIPLYRIRGTKAYLEELLELHLEDTARATVEDEERRPLQVGVSKIGESSYLGGGAPHRFQVTLDFPDAKGPRRQGLGAQYELARRVIDLSKPAHTLCELKVKSPNLQVGVHSTVGEDTLLGG